MTTTEKLKIAAAQYPIDQPETIGDWQAKLSEWVKNGAETGANILVFPEYAAMEQAACYGEDIYSDLKTSLAKVAEIAEARVAIHGALAAEHGVYILVGSGPVISPDGRYVNAAQLITPEGKIGVQEKMIMTPFEHSWGISAGGPVRIFETAIGTFGIAICYDSEFPLLARAMAEAGAEVLLVPSCTDLISGYYRVRTASLARALENTIVTVQSPTVGDALWSPAVDTNAGCAGIYVPSEHQFSDTGVLAQGDFNEPQWVYAEVDLKRLRHVRETGEMRNYKDWALQPGVPEKHLMVERVSLR